MKLFNVLVFSIVFASTAFLLPKISFASEKINNFDVSIVAHQDGTMIVQESIEYDFGEIFRHGIFREIPLVSKVGDLYRVIAIDVQSVTREGESENYEVDRQPKDISIKIGDPDRTITGVHDYLIIYTVENGIGSNFQTHDEIYWNGTGNDWLIPIEKASLSLTTDFGVVSNRAACFTRSGNFSAQFCTFPNDPPFNPIVTTDVLQPGDGLTVVYGFPVGTFPKSILQKKEPVFDPDFLSFLKIYAIVWAGLNFLLSPCLLYWYFKKKSKVRFGSAFVNFDIPKIGGKTIMPAEAGIIDSFKLERDDVVATIFDLAIKKYVKIEEVKIAKALRPDETDYKIIKIKSSEGLSEFEKELYDKLFEAGESVKLADLKKDFYLTFSKLEAKIFKSLKDKKLYTKNPKDQMALLLVFGVIALISGNLILGPVLIFLSRKLNGRTAEGDKIDWEVDGLKIFLKAVSRHHKFQSKNLITVEKYIPFAIALGLQDEFMEQLKIINPEYSPSWYSGSHGFYSSYPLMYSSFGSNVTTSAPSSSSGFSGGGSSGGGGGGGGGGSW